MIDLLDYGFAWLAVLLAIILAIVYITRKIAQSRRDKNNPAASLNRSLRKPHKTIGALLIMAGVVHGLASSQVVWSFNYGTISWILSILLGLNFLLRDKLKAIGGWLIYHRILTVIFIFSIVWHIVDVGGIRVFDVIAQGSQTNTVLAEEVSSETKAPVLTDIPDAVAMDPAGSSPSVPPSVSSSAQADQQPLPSAADFQFDGATLKDGVYTGSADAFGPNLTVDVTVENGKVSSVEVVSHNERNSRYYAAPMQMIPEEIVQNQSVNVDIVSGATFTSVGIKNAVLDALSGAVINGQLPKPETLTGMRKH